VTNPIALSLTRHALRSPYAVALPATPQAHEPLDAVTLSGAAEDAPSVSKPSYTLAVVTALMLAAGAFGATAAHAAEPRPPQTSVSQTTQSATVRRITANPTVTQSVRTYVTDMVENNRIQSATLNTYQKSFQNNYNTLVRIERRIVQNPESLADPAVRRVYEKTQAALDSIQVYSDTQEDIIYRAASQTIETPNGTRITMPMEPVSRVPRTTSDYSGSARMTDRAVEQIQEIMGMQVQR